MNHGDQSGRALRAYWDAQAAAFDDEPDHGMRDPAVRDAWQEQLVPLLPPPPAAILDIGCGTGTLAVLLGGLGYRVAGADLSPAMIARAKR